MSRHPRHGGRHAHGQPPARPARAGAPAPERSPASGGGSRTPAEGRAPSTARRAPAAAPGATSPLPDLAAPAAAEAIQAAAAVREPMPLEVVAPAEAPEPGLAVGATIVGEVVANLPVAGASAAGNLPLPGASAADRDEAATGDRVRAHLGSAPEERPAPGDRPASERSGMAGGPAQPRPRDDGAAGQPGDDASRPTCTVPQLRRFIKSRPWVPMHELRRRFGIAGVEDDVSPMRVGDQRIYIGLPPTEARLMAELLTAGDVGYELSLDPVVPVVVGVYPMRPVPRA